MNNGWFRRGTCHPDRRKSALSRPHAASECPLRGSSDRAIGNRLGSTQDGPFRVDSGGSRSILAWIADQPVGHVRELLPRNLTGIRHYLTGASDGSQDLAARSIHQVTEALECLMEEDAAAKRLIAKLAINKARDGLPAPGFFDCAQRHGRFSGDPDGDEARTLHTAELHVVFLLQGRFARQSRPQPGGGLSRPPAFITESMSSSGYSMFRARP